MNVIHKLDPTTVNRIAAGEVVQKPAAAIKELLENSIDAGSTVITVTIKQGGLDLMQIQDNGCGIRKEDLGIVCERFTTSKITNFDDLKSISTFGFRGEALASITHVAHVTITTKTAPSPCAYKSKYSDGKPVPLKHGDSADPKPCAGVNGTTITVEDLFYNMKTRRNAFKNTSEQYQKILDVVTKYSIHYGDSGISFTCRKHGQSIPDLHTPSSQSSTLDNIRISYGQSLARELLKCDFSFQFESGEPSDRIGVGGHCRVQGYFSNANYSTKKSTFIFFINHRLVECAALKKTIENYYAEILPKNSYPFVYVSIEMPPEILDVNIHPTKKEVCFLHETQLLRHVYSQLSSLLKSANESRAFTTQTIVPHVLDVPLHYGYQGGPEIRDASSLVAVQEDAAIVDLASNDSKLDRYPNSNADDLTTSSNKRNRSFAEKSNEPDLSIELFPLEGLNDDENDGDSADVQVLELLNSTSKRFKSAPQASVPISKFHGSVSKVSNGYFPSKAANKLVRTDPTLSRIDQFFPHRAQDNNTNQCSYNRSDPSSANSSVLDPDERENVTTIAREKKASRVKSQMAYCMPIGSCLCCGPSAFVPAPLRSSEDDNLKAVDISNSKPEIATPTSTVVARLPLFQETKCQYISVLELNADFRANTHVGVESMLKKLTYVGTVDSIYMLVQVGTKLLLLNHLTFSTQLFYQLAIRRFGILPSIVLKRPVDIRSYVEEALLMDESCWSEDDGDINAILDAIVNVFRSKRDLLREYFSIDISEDGSQLCSVPELLSGYTPDPHGLPTFLLRLGTMVDWEDEKGCFCNIAEELSIWYSALDRDERTVEFASSKYDPERSVPRYCLTPSSVATLCNLLIPAYKQFLFPQRELISSGSIIEATSLEKLYKVFERC